MEKLLEDLALIEEYADNFVTHWMEDDGNDAEDKARCERVDTDISDAAKRIRAALSKVAS